MQIGFTISDFGGKQPGELLALAKSFGVSFVEFNPTVLKDLEAVCSGLNGVVAGFHLPLVSEHGYDLSSVAHKDKIDNVIHELNHHRNDLNLVYCVTHPPETEEKAWLGNDPVEYLIDNLLRLEVPIIIENVESWNQPDFDRLYQTIHAALGRRLVGQCFDPAHAYLRGENIFERFDQIAEKVLCIHLSDCAKGHDAHLPLGQGELPVGEFLHHVARHQFDGIINLEVAPQSLSEMRSLIESYLKVLRVFKKGKFFTTALRAAFQGPRLASLTR